MSKVDFFIVGAPKSGTTALYSYLSTHPDIFLPQHKEPNFFAEDYPNLGGRLKTFGEYEKLFSNHHKKIAGEGKLVAEGPYKALILVNGYLGPDLALSDQPLGSVEFYLFGIKDRGAIKLLSQVKHARNGTIINDPIRWGFESHGIKEKLELIPNCDTPFPVNVDGSTFIAQKSMSFKRVAKVPLIRNTQ